MKTEKKAEEDIRESKKKVFWSLYSLPWTILVLILSIFCFVFLKMFLNVSELERTKINNFASTTTCSSNHCNNAKSMKIAKNKQKWIEQGMELIYREAFNKGYGKWQVDNTTLKVSFVWEERGSNSSEVEQRGAKEGMDRGKDNDSLTLGSAMGIKSNKTNIQQREYPFTYTDYEFCQSIGMDLEEDIVGSVRVSIQKVFINLHKNKHIDLFKLENELKDKAQEAIQTRFDGFETYKKVQ